jgi:hypothetical protein
MINRVLIATCLVALFVIMGLNFIPLFWTQNLSTYIRQDHISGMAVRHDNRLYTLNYAQQKQAIDIFNRAIPMGKIEKKGSDPKLEFDQIVIYRFKEEPITITPLTWLDDKSLYFEAPQWSQSHLKEVSKGQLYQLLEESYDRQPYN